LSERSGDLKDYALKSGTHSVNATRLAERITIV
jgi:hypothetical protein